MHFVNIYIRRKEILLIFFRHFVELPAKNHGLIIRFIGPCKKTTYWTTFETLAEIERLQGTTTLHGRLVLLKMFHPKRNLEP